MRARFDEQQTHLPQIIIDDRLATIEPERLNQLTDAHARESGILTQQAG
jgi:hypothetical protein